MIPFESMEAMMFNDEAFSHIYSEAQRASVWMGTAWGSPEWVRSYVFSGEERGRSDLRRNCSLIAIAPTKSTALIMGGVSEGINPDVGFTYTQGTAAGEINRVSPVILNIMKQRDVYDAKHIKQITDAFGSVQGVDWLTDEEKRVMKTAFEINQYSVIRLASQRAKYIDQWQSLNLFFAGDAPSSYIAGVHKEALADDNIIGLYYLYSMSGVAGSDPDDCEVCQ